MANTVSVPKVQTSDRNINQLQQNLISAINQLQQQINTSNASISGIIPGGVFVNNQALQTGNNTIIHSLGSIPTNYLITNSNAEVTTYLISATSNSLTLHASADATVNLFVF